MNCTVHESHQKYEQSYEEVSDWYVQRSVSVQQYKYMRYDQCTSYDSLYNDVCLDLIHDDDDVMMHPMMYIHITC